MGLPDDRFRSHPSLERFEPTEVTDAIMGIEPLELVTGRGTWHGHTPLSAAPPRS